MVKPLTLLLFLPIFFLYTLGVSHSVYGGDSGDIILASWFGGVAHPPGYPLNTMIGWVFTHLPFNASVAYKANLMAGFMQAATIVVIFVLFVKLTNKIFLSLVGALVLAFNPLYWLYAHIIEVFQLNLLLVSISVLFLILWEQTVKNRKEETRYLFISVLFLGFSVFHHHTSLLLAPAFLYFLVKTKKKLFSDRLSIFKLVLVFSLGFLPYVFIPFAAFRETPINWDNPQTPENFIRLITRADYGTFQASTFIIGDSFQRRLVQVANYGLFVRNDFGYVGTFLIILGIVATFRKKRKYFGFLLLACFFTGPFFLFYGSFPLINDFYVGLWERFILLSYLFLVILLVFGLEYYLIIVKSIVNKLFSAAFSKKLMVIFQSSIFLFPLVMALNNFEKTNLSDFRLGDWLGMDTLASAERNSIVFLAGDTSIFNTQYVNYTSGNPQEIKILKSGSLGLPDYRDQVKKEYKELDLPEDFTNRKVSDGGVYVVKIIENNKEMPIYSANFFPIIDGYRWTNRGLLKKLVKNENYSTKGVVSENKEIFINFAFDLDYRSRYEHYIESHLKDFYYFALLDLADELFLDEKDYAHELIDKAIKIFPAKKDAYIRLGNLYFSQKSCDLAKEAFETTAKIDPKDWQALSSLSNVYKDCYHNELEAERYKELSNELQNRLKKKII